MIPLMTSVGVIWIAVIIAMFIIAKLLFSQSYIFHSSPLNLPKAEYVRVIS